jgi:enolase
LSFLLVLVDVKLTCVLNGFQDKKVHHGKGVLHAVANVNEKIAPALVASGIDPANQKEIDAFLLKLDGTANKSGQSLIWSVSCHWLNSKE